MHEDMIINEIMKGVAQVDSSLSVDKFDITYDKQTRVARAYVTIKTANGETVEVNNKWD